LECYDGFTDLGIFIYFDDVTLEECEECRAPDSDEDNVVVYYFEIPCKPICSSFEPSPAPVSLSLVPTDCVDQVEINIIETKPDDVEIGSEIINIIDLKTDSVSLEIVIEDDFNMVSIGYDDVNNQRQCYQDFNLTQGENIPIEAACYEKFASLTVFFFIGDDFDIDHCAACSLPNDGTEGYIAITFEISCESICKQPSPAPSDISTSSPSDNPSEFPSAKQISSTSSEPSASSSASPSDAPAEPECYSGVVAMHKDTGGDPMCEYSTQPFTIEELDDSGSNELRFSFTNNWPTAMSDIELRYDRGDGLGKQCQSLNSLSSGSMYPNTLAAACDPSTKTADIEVYVSSTSIDHSSSINQCGAPQGSCSYVYKVPCSPSIMCEDIRVRQLNEIRIQLGHEENENIERGYIARGFMTDEMKAAEEIDEDFEDLPFCVHKDHPCEGDEEKMVYVCHYSPQKGYQTFCIPEMDSDILQFDGRNHCGPCDGWNGVENSGQFS